MTAPDTTSLNNDTVQCANPYAGRESKIAYRIKRSGNTDTATGRPFVELYNGSERLARFVADEKPGFMQVLQKSMHKPWSAMRPDEAIDLHPTIRVSFRRELGVDPAIPSEMSPAAWRDDLERDTDRRKRALWSCECLAETLHVKTADWQEIARKHITAAAVPDLDGATAAIRAKAKTEDGAIVIPNIEAATKLQEKYKATMDAAKEAEKTDLDEFIVRDENDKPAADATARNYGSAWQSIRTAYKNLEMHSFCAPTVSEHDHQHIILKVNSLKELSHLSNTEISERFVRNCMEIKGMTALATTKHWAEDPKNVAIVLDRLSLHADDLGVDPQYILQEAARAVKVKKWIDYPGTGAQFVDDVLKAWEPEPSERKDDPSSHKNGHSAQTGTEAAANANGAQIERSSATETTSVAQTVAPTNNIIPFINIQTLTGINVLDIPARLNAHLPPEAYGAIKFGQMSGKTDIDGEYVRDRFDQVFGPMGIGWRITPNALAGRVEHKTEDRQGSKGELKTWHIVTLVAHTFEYCVVQNGVLTWVAASTTSDQHDNVDEQYAYRGALTSIMKQFYSLMGGMNHVRRDEYTHIHAAKDLAKQGRKTA